MDKFLETHSLSSLNHEEKTSLNRPIKSKKIDQNKKPPTQRQRGQVEGWEAGRDGAKGTWGRQKSRQPYLNNNKK